MKHLLLTILIVVFCSVLPAATNAAEVQGIDIVEYGIYKNNLVRMERMGITPTDDVKMVDDIVLLEKTDRVPAKIDTSFGLLFMIKGTPEGATVTIRKRVLTPGIKNPETGKVFFDFAYTIERAIGAEYYTGYQLAHDWGLVPGEYTIQLFYEDRKLAEKAFTVYKP